MFRGDMTGVVVLRHFYPACFTPLFCEAGWLNRMFHTDYLTSDIACDQACGCQPSVLFMDSLPYRSSARCSRRVFLVLHHDLRRWTGAVDPR
jgi:hypothetical protein